MLDTRKVILILPEIAFICELLPDKKPNSFLVHACTQVNGSFVVGQHVVMKNIAKLFQKLEPKESYYIILPDSLFLQSILTLKVSNESELAAELEKTVLPDLGLSPDEFQIITKTLTQRQGNYRLQVTALSKESLVILSGLAHLSKVELAGVTSLSWSVKGMISLEPSLTVVQAGDQLFVAQHYIGVEKCTQFGLSASAEVLPRLRQLKEQESSIMTVYLLTDGEVEKNLKADAAKFVPFQQMTSAKTLAKLPSHVATLLEQSMRTLSVTDFPVPLFSEEQPSDKEQTTLTAAYATAAPEGSTASDEVPPLVFVAPAVLKPETSEVNMTAAPTKLDDDVVIKPEVAKVAETDDSQTLPKPITVAITAQSLKAEGSRAPTASVVTVTKTTATPLLAVTSPSNVVQPAAVVAAAAASQDAIDLRQFVGGQSAQVVTDSGAATLPNEKGAMDMWKIILITGAIFLITIAIGIGIGLFVLKYANKTTPSAPVVTVQPTATPTPAPTPATASDSAQATPSGKTTPKPSATPKASASPTSSATTDASLANQKILVVNATDKAGYAGQMKDKLTKAGAKSVTAQNAKGKYDAGDYVYSPKPNDTVLTELEKATGLALTQLADAKQEGSGYDYIVVLAQ